MKDILIVMGVGLLITAFVVVATAPIYSAWWSIPVGLASLGFLGIDQFMRR